MDLDVVDCASEAAQTLISKKPKQAEVFFSGFWLIEGIYVFFFFGFLFLGFDEFDGIWLFVLLGFGIGLVGFG